MVQPQYIALLVGLLLAVGADVFRKPFVGSIGLTTVAAALIIRCCTLGLGDVGSGLLSGVLGAGGVALVFSGFSLRRRGLDWSDVTLLSAVGAGLGWPLVLPAMLFISVTGAVSAVVFSIWKGELSATLRRVVKADGADRRTMPYSVAIAVGSVWAIWWARASS